MLGSFVQTTASLIVLALVFATLVAVVFALDNPNVRTQLRQQAWYRDFEALPPSELQVRGFLALGSGVCSFAALLTLRLLFPGVHAGATLALALLSVVLITIGATLLERAAPR